jgi:hypothetical protein
MVITPFEYGPQSQLPQISIWFFLVLQWFLMQRWNHAASTLSKWELLALLNKIWIWREFHFLTEKEIRTTEDSLPQTVLSIPLWSVVTGLFLSDANRFNSLHCGLITHKWYYLQELLTADCSHLSHLISDFVTTAQPIHLKLVTHI